MFWFLNCANNKTTTETPHHHNNIQSVYQTVESTCDWDNFSSCPRGDCQQTNYRYLLYCHPDTEIFSKRRKIYSSCVDGRDDDPKLLLQQNIRLYSQVTRSISFWIKRLYNRNRKIFVLWFFHQTEKNTVAVSTKSFEMVDRFFFKGKIEKHSLSPNQPVESWQTVMCWTPHPVAHSYRFSAFWLRSKCSICSYQLNIWYENHVFSSILNWFL